MSSGSPASSGVLDVEAKLDEATATQIVYLYDQISHAYRGDAPDYFDLVGRKRNIGGTTRPSLRSVSVMVMTCLPCV
mgnify:CR=1 FL=1